MCIMMTHHRRATAGGAGLSLLRRRVLLFGWPLLLLLCSALLLGSPVASAQTSRTFPQVHRQQNFLMQALLQAVAGDFLGDGRTGLMLSGRNYESREAYVHLLYWTGDEFTLEWRSHNLWEEASHISVAAGDFTGAGRTQLAVLTTSRVRLFEWDGAAMTAVYDGPGFGAPAEIGVIRHPEHPYDLIAVTRRHGVEHHMPRKGIELIGWRDDELRPLWETPTIGRVRAITSGSWSGAGRYDFVFDVGDATGPGLAEVWSWDDGGYVQTFSAPLRSTPTFGLTTARVGDTEVLVAADDRGYATVFGLQPDMPVLGQSPALGWALVSAAAGDFFGNGGAQAVIVGYPSRLHVIELRGL